MRNPYRAQSNLHRLVLSLFMFMAAVSGTSEGKCQQVVIKCTIRLEAFPGPPNYESIEEGDEKLLFYIAYFNSTNILINNKIVTIDKAQIIKSIDSPPILEGKTYCVHGHFEPGTNARHVTEYILIVDEISESKTE